MAVALDEYAPYDAGPGALVTEDRWRKFARHFRGDGVIRNELNVFFAFADSTGMQVKVRSGECWIQGQWGVSTSEKILTVPANSLGGIRNDLVVLRNDYVNNEIVLDYKVGNTSTYPALTQNASMHEIQVAKVRVPNAAVTIAANAVNPERQYIDASARYTVDGMQQLLAGSTDTRIDFDLPQFENSYVGRNGINRFVLNRAGQWLIIAGVTFTHNAVGNRLVWISKEGEVSTNRRGISSGTPTAGADTAVQAVCCDRFEYGDEVAVWAWANYTGANVFIRDLRQQTHVSLYWLGP